MRTKTMMTSAVASSHLRTLASALDTLPDAVIIYDMQRAIQFFNKAALSLYGYSISAMEGRDIDELLLTRHPHGLDTIKRLLFDAGQWSGELYRRSATGAELKIGVDCSLQFDEANGNIPCFVVERSRDLTRTEEIAEQVRIASHRYENIFQAMAASFWELDFSGVRRMIGELMQAGVTDLAEHFHKDEAWLELALRNTIVLDVNDKTVEMFGAETHTSWSCRIRKRSSWRTERECRASSCRLQPTPRCMGSTLPKMLRLL
ncbi:PAS domain-containing protein [Rhizobium sp. SL86]|uniref:PAS domain-containing protein n=1 Tax=Rhizobium sp. SL86 TaxID=2995148 RepID=UPI002275BC19|nr:PAS domain-containing protein [Rhizobium sp. SL86]MCY1666593.1 PAS domain-containing protein [Rhizobium sp. SL86]